MQGVTAALGQLAVDVHDLVDFADFCGEDDFVGRLAVFFGHLFPVWLKFNGGKGVANATVEASNSRRAWRNSTAGSWPEAEYSTTMAKAESNSSPPRSGMSNGSRLSQCGGVFCLRCRRASKGSIFMAALPGNDR